MQARPGYVGLDSGISLGSSYVRRLGSAVHPLNSRAKLMLMLTAYFDETGHASDPNIGYSGMAGFVAPAGEWEILEQSWTDTLKNGGLYEAFHMRDFAHSRGQFEGWKGDKARRDQLCGRLMEIIRETKATPVGVIVSIKDFRTLTAGQQRALGGPEDDPYYLCFQVCCQGAALEAELEPPKEKVAVVFAHHPEFSSRVGRLWEMIASHTRLGQRLGSYTVSTPDVLCPLQAADLAAYELFHEFDGMLRRPASQMRWPMKQILKMAKIPLPRIRLFDRKELLRVIKETGFHDQTGVEELAVDQADSAMQQMMRRVVERSDYCENP